MIRSVARRSPRVRALYRGLRGFVAGEPPERGTWALPELQRLNPTQSRISEPRLNLVMGTVDPRLMYGGGPTALTVFRHVVDLAGSRSRIISVERLPAPLEAVEDHAAADINDESATRSTVGLKERPASALPVGPADVFFATYWSTAEAVLRVREWQRATYGSVPRFLVYIIQDFEPGFFPLSAQSLLARSTYEAPDETIAVFNTGLLRDYFRSQRFAFAHEFAFEPHIRSELRPFQNQAGARERTIVVYGRPHTPRNAFPLIVEALRRWRDTDPTANSWACVSVGELHEPVDLGGAQLLSLGKLDMATYGRLLARSAIGISLMVSPHPSYPPLEMAHLGLLVITNRFRDKDLSRWHENIISLDDVTPEGFAVTISEACARFARDPACGERGKTRLPEYLSDEPQFPFAGDIARLLLPEAAEAVARREGIGNSH